jgi:NAD(P)-dependent dehydrogenase (short-subunit alcohol dehydrogenase family)
MQGESSRRCEKSHSWLKTAACVGGFLAAREVWRYLHRYDLQGKVVLITGGSRGLGLVVAREFAKAGAHVAICARDAEELDRARADLVQRGADVLAVPCDVTEQEQVNEAVRAVQSHFGRVDVLVNNAGIIEVGPFETMTVEDFERCMKTHFWAALYGVMAVLPEMKTRGSGRIINVSSLGGKVGIPHLTPYCASKFALVGLSEGLRTELGKHGVVVTTVCPGIIRTGSHLHAQFKGKHEAEYTFYTLLGAVPTNSIAAESAAKRIVKACINGEAEVVLSLPAQAMAAVHGLFPGMTADVWGLVNRMLPGPGGIGKATATGKESETSITRSWVTDHLKKAARENNELPA